MSARRRTMTAVAGTAMTLGLVAAAQVAPATATPTKAPTTNTPTTNTAKAAGHARVTATHRTLMRYTRATWRSFDAMTFRRSGLPSDNIEGDLSGASRSRFTSPTNIGAYLWSTVVARDTGLIGKREAHRRMSRTIESIGDLDRHRWSGMFYNWYDPKTGKKLRTFPTSGDTIEPFLSSVDNGWLATGLLLAARADDRLAKKADRIREKMDFGFYYNQDENPPGGQIRGGFWDEEPTNDAAVKGNYRGRGPDVWYTGHHYGSFNTEPRMASYLGIAAGQIPRKHYFGTYRTFPNDNCDWGWTETKPVGEWRTYLGMQVFEGALPYRNMNVVPTWGGSMFEALMVPLFVPEEKWGPDSWGINHPLFVRGQIQHGMKEADYGYWGFSPSSDPDPDPTKEYREYGVDQLGLDTDGYTSDQERTTVPQAFEGCREAGEMPTEYGDGVVTPHASFLALRYAKRAALRNLQNIRDDFDSYGRGGFYDAVGVRSGDVAKRYLSLDQGMIMAALGNALAGDDMRDYVARGAMKRKLQPLMEMEQFSAGPAGEETR